MTEVPWIFRAGEITRNRRMYSRSVIDAAIKEAEPLIASGYLTGTVVGLTEHTHKIRHIERRGSRVYSNIYPSGSGLMSHYLRLFLRAYPAEANRLRAIPSSFGVVSSTPGVETVTKFDIHQVDLCIPGYDLGTHLQRIKLSLGWAPSQGAVSLFYGASEYGKVVRENGSFVAMHADEHIAFSDEEACREYLEVSLIKEHF